MMNLVVYQSPLTWRGFDPVVPTRGSYNDNITVGLNAPFRWLDPTYANDYLGVTVSADYKFRFAQRQGTRLLPSTTIDAALDPVVPQLLPSPK